MARRSASVTSRAVICLPLFGCSVVHDRVRQSGVSRKPDPVGALKESDDVASAVWGAEDVGFRRAFSSVVVRSKLPAGCVAGAAAGSSCDSRRWRQICRCLSVRRRPGCDDCRQGWDSPPNSGLSRLPFRGRNDPINIPPSVNGWQVFSFR